MPDYLSRFLRFPRIVPALLASLFIACAADTLPLNSERIDQRFGSYGIDVISNQNGVRRSNLYSVENGMPICRTYAVVRFINEPDRSYSRGHSRVLAGDSIGKVFKANGWQVNKRTLHIGQLDISAAQSDVIGLMKLAEPRDLAFHIYELSLQKGDKTYPYATIVEAHHPEYLTQSALHDIYPYDESNPLSADTLGELSRLVLKNDSL